MEFEDKILEINAKIKRKLANKKNIVIRGGGIDAEKLLSMTCILDFWDKVSIVDKVPHGSIGNKVIKGVDEIQWDLVDAVVISSLKYQRQMEEEILAIDGFKGEIIRLYEETEVARFFELQGDYDFLTLEKVDSWETASKKSRQGYADEAILAFDEEEFIEHKNAKEKNKIRHYYDVLFYMLRTAIQLQKKEITVLDFGGGFGTFFVDLRFYLKNLDIKFQWIIVEQEQIVERCVKEYSDIGIIYKKSLEEVNEKIDFALLASSIQYVENYQEVIRSVKAFTPYAIAVLKTPVSSETFVSVQHVNMQGNHKHYTGDYSCRVMSEEELISLFSPQYGLENAEEDVVNAPNNYLNDCIVKWKDFFFEMK